MEKKNGDINQVPPLQFDATISALAQSYWQYRRGVFGDCGAGITRQMFNRVTNHGDMGTFSKPDWKEIYQKWNNDIKMV